jgi:hypothetical protein
LIARKALAAGIRTDRVGAIGTGTRAWQQTFVNVGTGIARERKTGAAHATVRSRFIDARDTSAAAQWWGLRTFVNVDTARATTGQIETGTACAGK